MRIKSIRTEGVGPLPDLEWEPGAVEVIYDDNQQGKTTLIDLLIETVFREGRKKLFAESRRYDDFGKARVILENADGSIAFGEDDDGVAFSELLGWKLPELHRLLCIRASQVNLSGPRENEEVWESLASVIEGLQDNYLDSIHDRILDRGRVTGSFRWTNRDPDYFQETILEEVVPGLERVREGESVLREAIELKKKLAEAENREETLREQTLDELESKHRKLRRQLEVLGLSRAEDRLEEARDLKNEIDEDFGRIVDDFEEPWEQAREQLDDVKQRLDEEKKTLAEHESRRDELVERRDELRKKLEDLEGSIEKKERKLDELETEREDRIGSRRDERSTLDELARRAERARDRRDAWSDRWAWARIVLIAGSVLLAGSFVVTPLRFLYGLIIGIAGLVGTVAGAGVYWLSRYYEKTLDRTSDKLAEELEDWPVEKDHDPLVAALVILYQVPLSLLGDLRETIDSTRETVQSLREDRSKTEGTLENVEEQLDTLEGTGDEPGTIEAVKDEIDEDEDRLQDLEETCEEFRQKTGLPDFETYRERLGERRDREGKLQSLTSQLIGQLDLDEEAGIAEVRSEVQRRMEELGDVEVPDRSPEKLEREIEETEDEIDAAESELEDLQERIRSLNDKKNETVRPLHDLGVDLDSPEVLFEKENKWETQLTEAVRDRLAAAYCVRLLEEQKGDYMESIQELLERGQEDDRNLSEMYATVMGEENTVSLDTENGRFSVHQDGIEIPESGLSSGARTHLYFACRLMLLKELFVEDPGFMILDDPFLTYFPERKKRAVDLLEPFVEDGWQLLFFTVDPTARDHFSETLDAEVRAIEDLR